MKKNLFLFLLFVWLPLAAELLYENPSVDQSWKMRSGAEFSGRELVFSLDTARRDFPCIRRPFDTAKIAGRLIAVSAEIKGEKLARQPEYRQSGIRVRFEGNTADGGKFYSGLTVNREGSFDWQNFRQVCHVPAGLQSADLAIGLQGMAGKFQLRDLKIEELGTPLAFAPVANMEYRDEVAGDGKGGWSDQGPEDDGSPFLPELWRKEWAGFPFLLQPKGKSILSFASPHFPAGLKEAEIPVTSGEAKFLYLLHTLCWGDTKKEPIGKIEVIGEKNTQVIVIENMRDVQNWWSSGRLANAVPAFTRKAKGGTRSLFASRYQLSPELGKIRTLRFTAAGNTPVWIVCAATLSSRDIDYPKEGPALTITPGEEWLPLPKEGYGRRLAGSALDLSGLNQWEPAGTFGRIQASERGTLCFEQKPGEDLRMLAAPFPLSFPRYLEAGMCLDEYAKQGVRCLRFHFLDRMLMQGSPREGEFNTKNRDIFDRVVAEAKKRGMYVMVDVMTCGNGYFGQTKFNQWGSLIQSRNMKLRIHFDPEAREDWLKGARELLLHQNPYTGQRLIDDPVLAMLITFNEQSFAFSLLMDKKLVAPHYRAYLQRVYGTIAAYNQKNRSNYRSFEEIPCFNKRSDADRDGLAFIEETERNTQTWYREELRKLGYKGIIAGCNLTKNHAANTLRLENEVVAINSYHDHPTRWAQKGSNIRQNSSVETAAGMFRDLISARLHGKPLIVSEYNHVFWNRFRHQQPFTAGAYAALNDLGILTMHGATADVRAFVPGDTELAIRPFENARDPIAAASEFLTYFLFVRGDVATARHAVRIAVPEADRHGKAGLKNFPESQNALALLLRFSGDYAKSPRRTGEAVFPLSGGSDNVETDATMQSRETGSTDASKYIALLKKEGLLPASNRSDGRNLFESETGEILLDRLRDLVRIDTPRFQGICAPAGTTAELRDFEIQQLGADAGLTLVSVDGMTPIRTSKRLVLVFATNALNSQMQFSDKEMRNLYHIGYDPPLLRSGSFRVAIRSEHAEKLKLYPLSATGRRLSQRKPEAVKDGKALFAVDTRKDGAAIFFEISPD